jgi:hypothetical protein
VDFKKASDQTLTVTFFPRSIPRLQNLNLKNLQALDYLDLFEQRGKKDKPCSLIFRVDGIKLKVTTPIEANFGFNLDLAHQLY